MAVKNRKARRVHARRAILSEIDLSGEDTERRVIVAFDVPAILRAVCPNAQTLVPHEQGRVDDDEGHDAHRKKHQSKSIHDQNLKTIIDRNKCMLTLSLAKSP